MNIIKADLKLPNRNLIRFFGKQVLVEGTMKLRVMMETWLSVVNMDIDFLIVNTLNNAYNAILGKTSLNKARAIISTYIC